MTVLIITRSDDNHCVNTVMDKLAARGHKTFRFDSDRFPGEVLLSERHAGNGDIITLEDPAQGARLNLSDVSAMWYRRLAVAGRLDPAIAPELRHPATLEAGTVIGGLLASVTAFCLDPVHKVKRASNKALQLRVARECGLLIPATLTTNKLAEARRFREACDGKVISKMLSSFAVHDEAGREQVVFTNRFTEEDMAALDNLDLCPITLQEEIPKRLELRATVVGGKVFCASVDSAAMDGADVDWRRRGLALCDAWMPYELPAAVRDGLLAMTRTLGLHYGAADLIVHPDGRYLFLEVNPAGEFFWLDGMLPLTDALADLLAGNGRRW